MDNSTARADIAARLILLAPYWPAGVLVLLQLLVYPATGGAWVLGLVTGLLTALLALGLALVYRANRILNFAQGDLGTVPTMVAVGLITVTGLPYLIGVTLGLVAALALGVVVDLVIIGRFAKAPRLLLTVATIGLSQLLIVSGLLLPRLWGLDIFAQQSIPDPFSASFTIGTQNFGGSEITALVLAPLLLLALAIWLRSTDVGVAVRASADSADRAALLGIPVRRLQTVVWAVAAVLSFIGVFLHASIFGVGGAAALSPQVLVFALGALVLGRLDHLPAVAASAVALRILAAGIDANNPSTPGRVYVVLAAVVLGVLVLRRGATGRAGDATVWTSAGAVRPIPPELLRLPLVRHGRRAVFALLLVAAAALPLVLGPGDELKASTVAVFALIALSIVVLTGWAGQVSLGQMSFVSVGAAVGAVGTHTWGLDVSAALVVAGIAGAVVAVVVGLPALRLPGLYLAITTLAFALASSNFLLNRRAQTWIPRDRLDRPVVLRTFDLTSQAAMYEFVLVVVLLAFLAVAGIRASRTGRALLAVRDNDQGAAAYGIGVVRAKLTGLAISGFLAATAGCLLVHVNQTYTEAPFVAAESLGVFTAAVVGGLGSLGGAVIGALYLSGGLFFLPDRWRLLPSALGVLAVLMVLPGGLGSLVVRGRDALLRRIARRRGLRVPSLLADMRPAGGEALLAVPDDTDGSTASAAAEPEEVIS